jgi:hypothetical protein
MSDLMRELRAAGRFKGLDWPEPGNSIVEVRPDEGERIGVIDEIVAKGVDVHIERMDRGDYWMSISKDGEEWHLWFRCKGKLEMTGERQ